jgi:hypothetical protein
MSRILYDVIPCQVIKMPLYDEISDVRSGQGRAGYGGLEDAILAMTMNASSTV